MAPRRRAPRRRERSPRALQPLAPLGAQRAPPRAHHGTGAGNGVHVDGGVDGHHRRGPRRRGGCVGRDPLAAPRQRFSVRPRRARAHAARDGTGRVLPAEGARGGAGVEGGLLQHGVDRRRGAHVDGGHAASVAGVRPRATPGARHRSDDARRRPLPLRPQPQLHAPPAPDADVAVSLVPGWVWVGWYSSTSPVHPDRVESVSVFEVW